MNAGRNRDPLLRARVAQGAKVQKRLLATALFLCALAAIGGKPRAADMVPAPTAEDRAWRTCCRTW